MPPFNREALSEALRTDQAGKSTFPEFLAASWRAGVVRYDVDFAARTVAYYGCNGGLCRSVSGVDGGFIQTQLFVKMAGQPAGSPLPRPMQLHLFESYLHAKPSGEVGQLPISGKQCQRHGPFALFIENFDCSAPALALTVVDLSQIKRLPLDDLAAPAAADFCIE